MIKRNGLKKYGYMETIGIMALCNTASFNLVYIDNYGEYVIGGINNYWRRKYKLYDSVRRGYYFKVGNVRYYLDEFLRA